MQYPPTHSAGRKNDPWAFLSLAGRIRGRMRYAPTLPEGRGISPSAFPPPKRMGLKNVPPNPQPTRIGKSAPWAFAPLAGKARRRMQYAPTLLEGRKNHPLAFPSLAGRARERMQYAPTHSTGRKIDPSAFPSPKRMGFKNVLPNPQPTRIGKSDPWAFLSLAGWIMGRMQYAPTLPKGRGASPLAFPLPKRMGLKNVPPNPQPTRIGKSAPWAFLSLAGRIRGRMQYAPTLLGGRGASPSAFPLSKRMGFKNVPLNPQPIRIGKNDPWAFSPLAGRIRGRMQYAPTHSAGRKNHPWTFSLLAGRARGGYFCDLSLLVFSDHYPQTYFSFLVFRNP